MKNYGKWTPETEEIFHYESKIPSSSPDWFGIDAQVRVQAFGDHTLRLKFEGSKIYHQINDTLELPVSPMVLKSLLGYLEETVLVQLKRGHVRSFFVNLNEPSEVTNIKKSFLYKISHDSSYATHILLKTTSTGTIKEVLRKNGIATKLPLPSKIRKVASLQPTIPYITATDG